MTKPATTNQPPPAPDLPDMPLPSRATTLGGSDPLEQLRAVFGEEVVGQLPKPTHKDNAKGECPECGGWHGLPAIHLDYVGHAAVTDRLLTVDPHWNWEPLGTDENGLPAYDNHGGLWIKLTVAGVTRLGYGDGDTPKIRIGDALRNAAMRFGVALDLWTKDELESLVGNQEISNRRRRAPKGATPIPQESGGRVTGQDPATAGKLGMTAGNRNKIIRAMKDRTPPVLDPHKILDEVNKILELEGDDKLPALVKMTAEQGDRVFKVMGIDQPPASMDEASRDEIVRALGVPEDEVTEVDGIMVPLNPLPQPQGADEDASTTTQGESLTPHAVVLKLGKMGRELDLLTELMRRAEIDMVQKRHLADMTESKAFLRAEGSMDIRKHAARVEREDAELLALVAESVVRYLRAKIKAQENRIEIGRSMGVALRAELTAMPYQST